MADSSTAWHQQQAGTGCYLCPPKVTATTDILLIAPLSVSTLYLTQDQRFRGHSVLILNDHATALDALSPSTFTAFMEDLRRSAAAIRVAVTPDHMNIALLGNTCPHLHWAIVPRFPTDPRWGSPIWDNATRQAMRDHPHLLPAAEYSGIAATIASALTSSH